MVGMSLKLYEILKKIEDPNDELQEAFEEYNDRIVHGLLSVLKLRRKKPTVPLRYIDEILARLLKTLSPRPVSEVSDLYPLVASDFPLVQTAAYNLLNDALSEAQQQISVNVLLEKKGGRIILGFGMHVMLTWVSGPISGRASVLTVRSAFCS